MKGFFNKDKKKNNNPFAQIQNPFAAKPSHHRGGGKSLGGTKPGKIIPISIPNPGPIGAGIENTKAGYAIIAKVSNGSQAEAAGLQRGDVICFQGTDGTEEIEYKLFLEMAKADARPLVFDVRRVETKLAGAGVSSASSGNGRPKRAEDEARRQAVIAAAEARDKQNKNKKKPIRKASGELSAAAKARIEQQRNELAIKNATYMSNEPMSEEARRAVEMTKKDEIQHAASLGYNPYETMKGTGQQASTAVTTMTHGSIKADQSTKAPISGNGTPSTESGGGGNSKSAASRKKSASVPTTPIDLTFDDAFATLVTTNNSTEQIAKSLRIIRKLIQNATAEGQTDDKKRVRISNPNKHIQAAINDMNGALDVMFSVGFILRDHEEDDETYLLYTGHEGTGVVPTWLSKGLERLEQYENGL